MSLRRAADKQILNVQDFFQYAKSKESTIIPILVLKDEIQSFEETLRTDAQTLPGTRSYHHYFPISETVIACKTESFQEAYNCRFDLLGKVSYNWSIDD